MSANGNSISTREWPQLAETGRPRVGDAGVTLGLRLATKSPGWRQSHFFRRSSRRRWSVSSEASPTITNLTC